MKFLTQAPHYELSYKGIPSIVNIIGFLNSRGTVIPDKIMREKFIECFIKNICYVNTLEILKFHMAVIMEFVTFAKKAQLKEKKWVFLHQMPLKILVLLMSQFLDLCSGIKEFKSIILMISNETIGVNNFLQCLLYHADSFIPGYFLGKKIEEAWNPHNFFGNSNEETLLWFDQYKKTSLGLFDFDFLGLQFAIALEAIDFDHIYKLSCHYALEKPIDDVLDI